MKKVAIIFDLAEPPPPDQDYRKYEKDAGWDCQIDVKRALQRLGHEAILIGVYNDLERLVRELQDLKPDVIFNMVESFNFKRELEAQVAGLFELLDIPFTGTPSLGLRICEDKALTKKILSHHRIRNAKWIVSKKRRPIKTLGSFEYPAFIKPAKTESSEGISKDSLVENEKDALDRIHFCHDKFNCDVIVEEFIDGRELYISVLGKKRLQVFPIREIHFANVPDDEPKFATYKAKWDEAYRKKWGIRNRFAKDLNSETTERAERMAKKAFEVLHLKTYARFDMRLKTNGELVMLEANPNPSITDYDDFALSAKKAGISYDNLIAKILDLS